MRDIYKSNKADMASILFQGDHFRSLRALELPANLFYSAKPLVERLMEAPALRLHDLQDIWHSRPRGGWTDHPDIYRLLGEQSIRRGEPLLAYDILTEGTERWPRDVRLRQLLGLTLARSGALERGNIMLRNLSNEGHYDGETLGILASTYKDLWAAAPDSVNAPQHLRMAHEVYNQAYIHSVESGDLESAYYNGINAAATALMLGFNEQAQHLAGEVDALCEKVLATISSGADRYWVLASRGEAALITGRLDEAADHYSQAAKSSKGRIADLSSTRRQARMLLSCLSLNPHALDNCFDIPLVTVFSGCDEYVPQPDSSLEQTMRRALKDRLKAHGAGFGYASLISLSDLLFLEETIALGGEAYVVMPLPAELFARTLGCPSRNAEWKNRYHRLLGQVTRIGFVDELTHSSPLVAREYTHLILDGLGRLHSKALQTPMVPMALASARSTGGTDSLLGRWENSGLAVEIIELDAHAGQLQSFPGQAPEPANLANAHSQRIMALLFADVVGYSKIADGEIPDFIRNFLGAIAQAERDWPYHVVQKNTWGDAIYFVFEGIEDAALFALRLSRMVNEIDWPDKGISTPVDLRIALHAGPVYLCDDPIVERPSFWGTHVNWAARIEPITPPGHVYASQPFAALVESQGISSFVCDYVGQVSLAKDFGDFPLYHIH